ncbi:MULTISPECIES: hypothetical protein [Pseudanabaena]|jgi:hypothetical protein|uniref:hypothetical protein n=1 Tax=Pseudanabaena TaxID=1152 RepID=UPI002479BA28|nr:MULTISPECIES: hypothetical protein [Pseudanabaena]MEA5487092.1 hypothetical protein [Pseudanabaena sp. CCNP1317]WGS74838.1 hypothetical protein OA858_22850 [Pseudanabaena galeata CCNP1313]
MIEILVKVLGWQMVSQALRNRESAKVYSAQNPMLVKQSCKTLDDYWLNGNPREYLEGLETDLRNCLICNLATDISADVLSDYGLIEV